MFAAALVLAMSGPIQWQIFALRHPQETRVGKKSVSLAALKSINDKVNSKIIPTSEHPDVWSIWPHVGDCDDYAITKRHELLKRGVSSRLAVVKLKDGQYHLVLLVGDYVLDNLQSQIKRRNKVSYKFVMQQTSNPNKWIKF